MGINILNRTTSFLYPFRDLTVGPFINTLTCLRICAAMWWLQSKMIRNSRLLFISLRRGLVSCVSRGSWRIFSRMLYLDGAIISSCSLIRPYQTRNSTKIIIKHIPQVTKLTCYNIPVCLPVLSSYTTVAVFHLRNCTRSRIA